MKRLPIVGSAAVVAAGALASIPAVLGLAGNPSFSQHVPVRPPQHARVVVLQDSAAPSDIPARALDRPRSTPVLPTRSRVADNRGMAPSDTREAEPREDRARRQEDHPAREQHGAERSEGGERHGRDGEQRNEDG